MSDHYSAALERQIAIIRYLHSRPAEDFLREVYNNTPHEAATVRDLFLDGVQNGQTYYVAPAIERVLDTARQTIPEWTLTLDALPSLRGFVDLPHAIALPPHENGAARWVTAFSWTVSPYRQNPAAGDTRLAGQLSIDALRTWPGEVLVWIYFHIVQDRWDPNGHALALGLQWVVGQGWTHLADPANDYPEGALKAAFSRLFATFCAFVGSRIMQVTDRRPDRATRRRLGRDGVQHEPLIRVIELRRRAHQPREAGEHQEVDWSCQWIVREHWHAYHTRDGIQARWVTPYLKGPEDKPLRRPRAEVFAVVR